MTDWYETTCPVCGGAAHRETDVTDNFLCSGWYFLRYPSTDTNDAALDGELTCKILDMYNRRLVSANDHYPPLSITEGMDFSVEGVVIHSIRSHRVRPG